MIKKKSLKPVDVISGSDAEKAKKWDLPMMDGTAINADEIDERKRKQGIDPNVSPEPEEEELPALPTPEELQRIRDDAYEEGFNQGKADAQEKVKVENEALKKDFEKIIQAMAKPLESFDDVAEYQLAKLATVIAKQIVRREISLDQNQVIALVKEAVSLLPSYSQKIQIYLHPADAQLLRETFYLGHEDTNHWQLMEDPGIARGECRVHAEQSTIDASLDSRIARLAAGLLGDQRERDDEEDEA